MIFKCCHGRCNLSILLATAWWRNSLLMPYSTSWWVKVTVKSCDIALGKQAINALLLLQVPATGSAFPSPTGSSYQQHLQQVSPGFPPAPPVVAWTERSDEALRRHQEEIYMSGLNYVEWLKVNNDAMIIGSFFFGELLLNSLLVYLAFLKHSIENQDYFHHLIVYGLNTSKSSWLISIYFRKKLVERLYWKINAFSPSDHFISRHNLFSFWCIDIVGGN